jgi:hypothetical protein
VVQYSVPFPTTLHVESARKFLDALMLPLNR